MLIDGTGEAAEERRQLEAEMQLRREANRGGGVCPIRPAGGGIGQAGEVKRQPHQSPWGLSGR